MSRHCYLSIHQLSFVHYLWILDNTVKLLHHCQWPKKHANPKVLVKCSHVYCKKCEERCNHASLSVVECGLRGNLYTSSIARWKALVDFIIHNNLTVFGSSYGWDIISANQSWCFFRMGWVTLSANFRCKGRSSAYRCCCQKTKSDCSFICYQNVGSGFFHFVGKHRVWQIDGQTNRITIAILC